MSSPASARIADWIVLILALNVLPYLLTAAGLRALGRHPALASRRLHRADPPAGQVRHEQRVSAISLAIYSAAQLGMVGLAAAGVSPMRLEAGALTGPPLALSTLAVVLGVDAYWFWTHRLMHLPGVFRRVHAPHHRLRNPTPWAAYAQSVPESAINASVYLLLPLAFPSSVWAWLGLHATLTVFACVGHWGVELFPARARRRLPLALFNSATHHGHHHVDPRGNFGSMTALWDRVCGTNHPDAPRSFDERRERRHLPRRPRQPAAGPDPALAP